MEKLRDIKVKRGVARETAEKVRVREWWRQKEGNVTEIDIKRRKWEWENDDDKKGKTESEIYIYI